jgi:Flp pilus assembly protein TadB
MQRRKPAGTHPQWRAPEPLQSHISIAAMVAIAAAPLMLVALVVPRPLVLPVVCLIAVAAATITSLVAWCRRTKDDAQRVTAWDTAGALAFIACAAAMLGDPEHVVHLTDNASTLRVRE